LSGNFILIFGEKKKKDIDHEFPLEIFGNSAVKFQILKANLYVPKE
jgi:hypothetical protein